MSNNVPAWVTSLPTLNASLNALSLLLLLSGWKLIRSGRRMAHKKVMLLAFLVSVLFLVCYLIYHFALKHYTGTSSQQFLGRGIIRPFYFSILITHILLAALVPFLAVRTIYLGWNERWEEHRKIAKITLPIWLYVSFTGVVIYLILYHWPIEVI